VCPFLWPPVRIPSNAAACDRERQPSSLAGPFNAHPAERLATLIDAGVGSSLTLRLTVMRAPRATDAAPLAAKESSTRLSTVRKKVRYPVSSHRKREN
jgi:hypothetical protein